LRARLARLPLSFERNVGQSAPQVQFLAHLASGTLFLTHTEAVLVLAAPGRRTMGARAAAGREKLGLPQRPGRVSVLRLRLVGANAHAPIVGRAQLPGRVNYFLGNQPQRWHTHVPTYAQVAYHNVYPGVDLLYAGTWQQLTYDFVLAPGAQPAAIRLAVAGARRLALDRTGALLLTSGVGTLRQEQPRAYQVVGGQRRAIAVRYVLRGQSQVGLAVARYDVRQPLLIDPELVFLGYSSYLGGSLAEGHAIAVDSGGNAYVTGFIVGQFVPATQRIGPITNPFLPIPPIPVGKGAVPGLGVVFVAKLNASGSALLYLTYLGGSGEDVGNGIAVDVLGDAYVTGSTTSRDFPTMNPLAQDFGVPGGGIDAFVTKLNASGDDLVYSTYFAGSGDDIGRAIAVDDASNAYVTGSTTSKGLDTGLGFKAFGRTNAFVLILQADGSLNVSTYLGSQITDDGNTEGWGIAVRGERGPIYVTGRTSSASYFNDHRIAVSCGAHGLFDAFVTVLQFVDTVIIPDLPPVPTAVLRYSTCLGGSDGSTVGNAIAVDDAGNAYVTGFTGASDLLTTSHAALRSIASVAIRSIAPPPSGSVAIRSIALPPVGVAIDAFVAKLNPFQSGLASLVYTTYLGGSGEDAGFGIAVDRDGNAYVTGLTHSSNFPTTPAIAPLPPGPLAPGKFPAGSFHAFVTKLDPLGGLDYSTLLVNVDAAPNVGNDAGRGIAVRGGDAYVTGFTTGGFPTRPRAFQPTFQGGTSDAFVATIVPPPV
jgi:hypothetical protein